MKKLFMVLTVVGLIVFSAQYAVAQESAASGQAAIERPIHQQLKTYFVEGGAGFMGIIMVTLVLGLAVAIERILYLNLSTINSEKLLKKVEDALANGGVEAAKDVCRNTRGPVASVLYQGLCRMHEGVDVVEKTISSYGAVQMGLLEKGLPWVQLFIAIAPMIGFLGTVIGMIITFDDIQIAGDISPNVVAGGIKFALITTVAGLVVAITLQLFYNYILTKIDNLVVDMENSCISFIDIMVKLSK
ncbi:MAG: MotA/TolQ/ExbB proton channel family protein [Prevotellaceae bacterium]|jgi:biopolymer transport protein ExbB|nr:MotA/TolQ/ExbB proton channel family protein [Prevotellaceae bacterium]